MPVMAMLTVIRMLIGLSELRLRCLLTVSEFPWVVIYHLLIPFPQDNKASTNAVRKAFGPFLPAITAVLQSSSPSTSYNFSLASPGPSTISQCFCANNSPILTQIVPSHHLTSLHTNCLQVPPPHKPAFRPPRHNTIGTAPCSP